MKHRYWILFCVILISLGAFGCGDDITKKYFQAEDLPVLDEPTGSDGSYTISLAGGDCSGNISKIPDAESYLGFGYGGYGGELRIDTYGNTGLYVKQRELDDSFTAPEKAWTDDLGDNGVTISEETTIEILGDPPEVGDIYLLEGNEYLYQYVSGDPDDYVNEATGLKVADGATLTLELHYDWVSTGLDVGYYRAVYLDFEDDVVIDGTVRTDDLGADPDSPYTDRDKGALRIWTWGHFTTGADSTINTTGGDAGTDFEDLGDRGGYGGFVYIDGDSGIILAGVIDASGGDGYGGYGGDANGVSIYSDHSSIINSGPIYASGGNGDYDSFIVGSFYGGHGGWIGLECGFELFNTGNLYADGGLGDDGQGGNAGRIDLQPKTNALYNSGDCYARGGDGDNGGLGGVIKLKGARSGAGNLVNSGDLTVDSGDGADGNGGGNGEDFEIVIETDAGYLLTTGALSANGGDAAGEGEYYGGDGGQIRIMVDDGDDFAEQYGVGDNDIASGLCQVTNSISADGGDGPAGGGGGGRLVIKDSYDSDVIPPPVKPNELLGYMGVDLSGGDSYGFAAGHGGKLKAETGDASYSDIYYPGALANRVAINASGGDGLEGALGGRGGEVKIEAEGDSYIGTTVALNSGDIDISGGDGYGGGLYDTGDGWWYLYAGYGGEFFLYGHDYVENTGDINAAGGDNAGDTAFEEMGWVWVDAGYGGYIGIYSAFDALNTGDVNAAGGWATGDVAQIPQQSNGDPSGHIYGGYGGWFEISGAASTTNSGDIDLSGGPSTNDIGGEGGGAILSTSNSIEGASSNSGLITVVGGTGGTEDGADGFISIDGFVVDP